VLHEGFKQLTTDVSLHFVIVVSEGKVMSGCLGFMVYISRGYRLTCLKRKHMSQNRVVGFSLQNGLI
jgi:hypothetical protein